jgi:signal transduction histidine kinase
MRSNGLRLSIGAEAGAALVIAVGLFGLIAGVLGVTRHPVVVAVLALVSAAAVGGAARRGADLYAVPLALAAVLAFDFFYLPPYRRFGFPDYANWGALALYFVVAVLVCAISLRARDRVEAADLLRRALAKEQAALRRVATLVAHGVPPAEVFSAVSVEVAGLFGTGVAGVVKFEHEGPALVIVGIATNIRQVVSAGTRWGLDDGLASSEVFRTGRSARIDETAWSSAHGDVAATGRQLGIVSSVASPIIVDGLRWGAITVSAKERLPLDSADRLEKFTELVGTAIANAHAQSEIARLVDEQTALRRVATLVACGVPPEELFAVVVQELARLFQVELAAIVRREDHGATILASWSDQPVHWIPGTSWPLDPDSVLRRVFDTARPARMDHLVGAPIVVGGLLWGGVVLGSGGADALPADTEERIGNFVELIATAVSNVETRRELNASRARVVAAADEARRRLERDLHDGIQQRLVSLALQARAAAAMPRLPTDRQRELLLLADGLRAAFDEVRAISQGIHPAVLSESGLGSALTALARRVAIPIKLDLNIDGRLPEPLEVAAYYVVSEALTNAVKHARASAIELSAHARDGILTVAVRDDGVGGADPGGSGIVGLKDRIEALGGTMTLESPPGEGTTLRSEMPIDPRRSTPELRPIAARPASLTET